MFPYDWTIFKQKHGVSNQKSMSCTRFQFEQENVQSFFADSVQSEIYEARLIWPTG